MKQRLAMQVLGEIMQWDDDRAQREFAWLHLMSDFKYDSYGDYVAGARFIESLADWLQQFERKERAAAYQFIRQSLLFFSASEIQHLVELLYPEIVQRRLLSVIAGNLAIARYRIWSHPEATGEFLRLRRQSLFFGLSDGARIDGFRRANAGRISNEQVVLATEINAAKLKRLVKDLRTDLKNNAARFAFVFLLDDFVGTGKTLLRKEDNQWKGRLHRFWEALSESVDEVLEPGAVVHVHHYIATQQAAAEIEPRHTQMLSERGGERWFDKVEFSYGMILPEEICVTESALPEFFAITEKYYDSSIETHHTEIGGEHVKRGFGGAALPLVLEHNTPNNSIALLWAESTGEKGKPMRPLFRRRQRHSG
jgi:hypothetical protein